MRMDRAAFAFYAAIETCVKVDLIRYKEIKKQQEVKSKKEVLSSIRDSIRMKIQILRGIQEHSGGFERTLMHNKQIFADIQNDMPNAEEKYSWVKKRRRKKVLSARMIEFLARDKGNS